MKEYPSKILLFGEYSILRGSEALAIPYGAFSGQWKFREPGVPDESGSGRHLMQFMHYLEGILPGSPMETSFGLETFGRDINDGLVFDSDIPGGTGLGSSGAVVAAVYDRYIKGRSPDQDIALSRKELSLLENYFHKHSSGIDPLISYLNKPVWIKGAENTEVLQFSLEKQLRKGGMFLLDSMKTRSTAGLVDAFRKRCDSEPDYAARIASEYNVINNRCIKGLIDPDNGNDFITLVNHLSALQLELFHEMIPDEVAPFFREGLKSGSFSLKLCGAGGGGYYIGFASDPGQTEAILKAGGLEARFF